MSKLVIYTAISDGYDDLRPVPPVCRDDAHFVAFLDKPLTVPGWEIRPLCRRFRDPGRNAKAHKILAHRFFPDADFSLWIDGSVRIKSRIPLAHWAEEYLAQTDLAVYRHPYRSCLYQEGLVCLSLGLDRKASINRQMKSYSANGYPGNNGLAESTVLFRRHTGQIRRFDEMWYQEFKAHSSLDRLSFNYAAHQLSLKYISLPGTIIDNPHFENLPHKRLRAWSFNSSGRSFSRAASNIPRKKRASRRPSASGVSMVYLYYDNPRMLQRQIEGWNSYADHFHVMPEVLLIDDGSPNTCAADIVKECPCLLPLKVFRILEDIPWNFAGARNLGCAQAKGWIYVSDIDTLLPAEDAVKFFVGQELDRRTFYMPQRVWLPTLTPMAPAIVNLLFHKSQFLAIGGYDEDYSGHYGREETDFHNRLRSVAGEVHRPDVTVRVMSHHLIRDAHTITDRPRDKSRNAKIYARKLAAGFPKPVMPLRFSWKQVL